MNGPKIKRRKGGQFAPYLCYKSKSNNALNTECWPPTRQQKLSGKELRRVMKCAASDINSKVIEYLFDSIVEYLFHSPNPVDYKICKAA